jgi:hypothetical protein
MAHHRMFQQSKNDSKEQFLPNAPATSLNSLRILLELVAFNELTSFATLGVFGDVDISK